MVEGNIPSVVPRWTIAVHAVQLVFAIVVLGLDAYGIRYIPYNALIFSLVVCLCTMAVCAYLIAAQTFLHNMYNVYIALAVHAWLLLFWVIDLGLVANLAAMWGNGDRCFTTSYGWGGTYCYTKRDLAHVAKRDYGYTTYAAYYGALAAGAVFAAVQLVTWTLTSFILIMSWNKHRTAAVNVHPGQAPPPQYANTGQAVPMEKYGQPPAVSTPQATYAQPVQQPYPPYAQDPVGRQDTVSPVSNVGGYAPPASTVSQLSSPQHTGQHAYPPNATEVHTDPYNPHVPELANHR
jgi:hypothetical protein